MYKSTDEIKANVKLNWNHHNCKFNPGSRVKVNRLVKGWTIGQGHFIRESYFSKPIQSKYGEEGNVVAVSCTDDGLIRGYNGGTTRMYTRYYVQFNDDSILGIHSHALDSVEVNA